MTATIRRNLKVAKQLVVGVGWREIVFYFAIGALCAKLLEPPLYEVGRHGRQNLKILLITSSRSFEIVGARTW